VSRWERELSSDELVRRLAAGGADPALADGA
jgi:hypothetical protein